MIYDVIIIGAGAGGLFAGMNLDKSLSKLILEKTDKPGTKVLLSGGDRANVSNMNIDPEQDYFSQNPKFLLSVFSKFNQWDSMSFFAENNISLVEEDRGRLILESGKSKELLDMLLREIKKNKCEIKFEEEVCKIIPLFNLENSLHPNPEKSPHPNPLLCSNFENSRASTPVSLIPKGEGINEATSLPLGETEGGLFSKETEGGLFSKETEGRQNIYTIKTKTKKYQAKNVIVSTGGKTFFHTGTTGDGFGIAEKLGLKVVSPYRALCGMSTKKDLSFLSGISLEVFIELNDNNTKEKGIYKEKGPLLFTHFGVTGPCVHNVSNTIGNYLNSLGISEENQEKYILNNLSLDLTFDLEKIPKKIQKFFELTPPSVPLLSGEGSNVVNLKLQNWRSWKEAKVTGGGIDTREFDNHMQSKKYKGLYFVGEVVDVTGKTGGYNLQWAWSSSFVACENINKKSLI